MLQTAQKKFCDTFNIDTLLVFLLYVQMNDSNRERLFQKVGHLSFESLAEFKYIAEHLFPEKGILPWENDGFKFCT